MEAKPKIVVEQRMDWGRLRWCAECRELKLHEWHGTSGDEALKQLMLLARSHDLSGSPDDYEIEFR